MKTPKSNIKFIKDFMDSSPINQLLVMDAVVKISLNILESDEKEMYKAMKTCFVSSDTWIAAAKRFKEAYEKNYSTALVITQNKKEV
jgi:hypothetical protein